jgi:hypothetical protein
MIVMGIGPFVGSYMGSLLRDISGHYTYSIYFALGSFLFSILLATTLPLRVEYTKLRIREQGRQGRLTWI